ncbi:SGNH hydrolase domain-containing protein [Streptomyces sp. NPDC093982]|uniref:SGNH hydrolase domain-containing protein n=1 Tax=Streptomyces sp. NPDC093982 TaxID=3155077 RepID=UPI00341FEB61
MVTRSVRRELALLTPVLLWAASGCATTPPSSTQQVEASPSAPAPAPAATERTQESAPPSVGEAALSPTVRGKTVLVVGDSWAGSLGAGMSKIAAPDNVVITAKLGGCGIIMPYSVAGRVTKETNTPCLEWRTKLPQYMERYKPDAVLFGTAAWDAIPQAFNASGVELSIEHPRVRARFETHAGRALDILARGNAPVYLINARDDSPAHRVMNDEVQKISNKYKSEGVRLLDLKAQLCVNKSCPRVLRGKKVYDASDRPAPWSRDRLAKWILNSMFAEKTTGHLL